MNIGYPIIDSTAITTDYTDYLVKIDNNTIFTGKAWKNPTTGKINIKLNDILKKYINSGELPLQTKILTDYQKRFETSTGLSEIVYNNYTYNPNKSDVLSAPIGNKYDFRQYLIYTYWDEGKPTVYSEKNIVGDVFNYTSGCGDYAIYYLNTLGGWDCLLVKATKSESKTDYDYRTDDLDVRYLTEYTESFKVYSDYVINRENIHHLLNSTKVYLHNLTTDEITPVLVDTSSYDFKNRFSRLELTLKSARTLKRW